MGDKCYGCAGCGFWFCWPGVVFDCCVLLLGLVVVLLFVLGVVVLDCEVELSDDELELSVDGACCGAGVVHVERAPFLNMNSPLL